MPTTYVFEQLDDATRDYLLTARAREGKGLPGVFVKSSNGLPLIGCILGPIIIGIVLAITFTPDQIYREPNGNALLQTAGVLLGGWMVLAAFRSWGVKNSRNQAGHWLYADPLYLYEAKAEQVTVTPMHDVSEATAVHNLNNNAYQNTAITLKFSDGKSRTLTIADQRRAEAIVTFYNFLAWARGPEGFASNAMTPATLGSLAKYVTKNDNLPLDESGNVNLAAVELDVKEIPDEPQRVGLGRPHVLIYLFLLVAAVACFFVMRWLDIPRRDDAIYSLVTTSPVQPMDLRQYLLDDRNQRHRQDVLNRLGPFYDKPINQVKVSVRDPQLKEGMLQLLESLKRADQPIVSIRIREEATPPGSEAGMKERVDRLRDLFVREVVDTITKTWESSNPPSVEHLIPKPPPMGEQLISFVEAPPESTPHVDIQYYFVPVPQNPDRYSMKATITLRDDVNGQRSWSGDVFTTRSITAPLKAENRDEWASDFARDLGVAVMGTPPQRFIPQMPRFQGLVVPID